MTISNTITEQTVSGDGLTTVFDYTFPMGGTSDNAVLILTTVGGGTASVASSEFSITGVTSSTGGTFIYPLVGSPISSGESLTLKRVLPLVQDVSISNQSNFAPAATEGGLDDLTMIAQQLQAEIDTANAAIAALQGTPSTLGGTVFSVATGTGLFGGTITGSGTISITTGGITSGLIAAGAVVTASIGTGSVVTTSILAGAVVTTSILAGSVVTASILNTAVSYGKIQNFTASTLFGNPTTSSTTGSEITLGAGLAFTGTTIKSTQLLFSQTASVTVSNTTSETTLVGGGTGSVTLTASYLTVGKTLRLAASGYHSCTSSPTLNMKFKLGSTVVASTGAVTTITASNTYWEARADVVCSVTGSSGAVFAQGIFAESGTTPFGMANTTSVAINTTTSLAVGLTAQWSTASTTDSIACTNFVIEVESV